VAIDSQKVVINSTSTWSSTTSARRQRDRDALIAEGKKMDVPVKLGDATGN